MKREIILFDLDGTLLPIEMNSFLKRYFSLLTAEFVDIAEADLFAGYIYTATMDMINNNGEKYNDQVFRESFFKQVEVDDREDILRRFDRFYQEEFPTLKPELPVDPTSARLVNLLKQAGYQLILATNAVFPREAIEERMNWAGLNPADFLYITNYSNMHYCKPNLNFYQEIVEQTKIVPDQCIMIGNDMQEDMIAGKLGMATYLVTDYLIDRGADSERFYPDWTGSSAELLSHFENKLT
ncbi:MAG: HAD family hydrolase [Halanaerobiales bacterium]|nr:HAD family hydrolase [Halanaerobiales bacterium]